MANCNHCGAEVRTDSRFCPQCGQNLISLTMVCSQCGKPASAGKPFCRYCGAPLLGVLCPICWRPNRPKVKYCAHCGTPLNRQPPSSPYGTGKLPKGQILAGRYLILRKIAQGGMSAVYEAARAPDAGVKLAVKEMSFTILKSLKPAQQQAMIQSFRREFDLLSNLYHPNLVRVFDFLEENCRQYFIMEYLDGLTLETILKNVPSRQFLPTERVLDWARQLCDVLAYLHAQQPPIIYRDLKPSNIIELSASHIIRVFDFGIARFYKPGKKSDTVAFGTEGYLAPEIFSSKAQTNERTDVYALGVLMHELLTKHDPQMTPFQLPDIQSLNPNVPARVATAIHKAIENNPANRPATAEAFLKELFGSTAEIRLPPALAPSAPLRSGPVSAPPIYPPALQRPSIPVSGIPSSPMRSSPMVSSPMPSSPVYPSPVSAPQARLVSAPQVPISKSIGIMVSTPAIYLGRVQRGKSVSGMIHVVAPPQVSGQVVSTAAWLTPQTQNFIPCDNDITIEAKTRQLPAGSWQPSASPNLFTQLPGLLRGWLGAHLRFFVPGIKRYESRVYLSAPGLQPKEVTVTVDVCPPTWRIWLGWLGFAIAITLEMGLLIIPILLFLS